MKHTASKQQPGDVLWLVRDRKIYRCVVLEPTFRSALRVRSVGSDGRSKGPDSIIAPEISRNVHIELSGAVAFLLAQSEEDVAKSRAAFKAAQVRSVEIQAELSRWEAATSTDDSHEECCPGNDSQAGLA
ncbi:MAG: hypothetical protein ABFD77_02725 [Thermotogota bacterium]